MTPEPSNEYQKLVEALEQARREMIDEGHAGWPNLIEQALSALKLPHAGDDGWQDIATARAAEAKNADQGELVLCYGGGKQRIGVVCLFRGDDGTVRKGLSYGLGIWLPTHWRPLPTPPAKGTPHV